jgi:low molecular weight protein-tyrosine phosphatase
MNTLDELISTLKKKETIVVLFLCAGNIVRSPIAEMLLEMELEKRFGKTRIKVISAATTYFNDRIMDITKNLLINAGVTPMRILQFYPRNIRQFPELLEQADIIIGMEGTHVRLLPKQYRSKSFILSEIAVGEKVNIPDPWGDELSVYQDAFKKIKEYITKLVDRFEEWRLIP